MNTAHTASKLNWLVSFPRTIKQTFDEWVRNEIVDDDPYDQMLQDLSDQNLEGSSAYRDSSQAA
ncbi:hypothetical protein IQ268_09905 [Oculatella sp. LEGE 06141]|uniref:hypothetical protein n=1 Tax=Oculatella sp. LEGE 06141 TaxID=1828648 RepID=UPI00187E162A|nr:hypothetical protein [Oculatella sp. LEGE 06141]MBE9178873.1 hypothetical protein [Oculatella sp. LEGE 06141]